MRDELYKQAVKVVKQLQESGYEALFAGGFVRDMKLNYPITDIDIATSATPEEIEDIFRNTHSIGKHFGVIIINYGGISFETTTFRQDGKYLDGRHPSSITFCDREKDARRRDFTINGMYYDPIKDRIYDDVGGLDDLDKKILRFIDNPVQRINEDKLRMLRAVRFATKYGFQMEDSTFISITKHAAQINDIAKERIYDEMIKMLRNRRFRESIYMLIETGLMLYILPEVAVMQGVAQPPAYHPEGDVLEHTIKCLENLPEDSSDELLIAGLLHDVGKPATMTESDRIRFHEHDRVGGMMTREILTKYKRSNAFINHVGELVENHMRFQYVRQMKESTLKRFMRIERFENHLDLFKADCLASHGMMDLYYFSKERYETFQNENSIKPKRLINGIDLINLGMQPGPRFKEILNKLENLQLEGKIKSRQEAMLVIKKEFLNTFQ